MNDTDWPQKEVVSLEELDPDSATSIKVLRDAGINEPFLQKVNLECGHFCLQYWGNKNAQIEVGSKFGCYHCHTNNIKMRHLFN